MAERNTALGHVTTDSKNIDCIICNDWTYQSIGQLKNLEIPGLQFIWCP